MKTVGIKKSLFFLICVLKVTLADLHLKEWSSYSLECRVKNKRQFKFLEWHKDRASVPLVPADLPELNVIVSDDASALSSTLSFKNLSALNVGLYQCVSRSQVFDEEYVFVESQSSLLVPIKDNKKIVHVPSGGESVIPCRPTSAEDIELYLYNPVIRQEIDLEDSWMSYDPKVGFIIHEGKLTHHSGIVQCTAKRDGGEDASFLFHLAFVFQPSSNLGIPNIEYTSSEWTLGSDQTMTCILKVKADNLEQTKLFWRLPFFEDLPGDEITEEISLENGRISVTVEAHQIGENGLPQLTSVLTVLNVQPHDRGTYVCEAEQTIGMESESKSTDVTVATHEPSAIRWDVSKFNPNVTVNVGTVSVRWLIGLEAPDFKPKVEWLDRAGREIHTDLKKYSLLYPADPDNENKIQLTCIINNIELDDMGRYVLQVKDRKNEYHKLEMNLYVLGVPRVDILNKPTSLIYTEAIPDFTCSVTSYPISSTIFEIEFRPCETEFCGSIDSRNSKSLSYNQSEASNAFSTELDFKAFDGQNQQPFLLPSPDIFHGQLLCRACNDKGCSEDTAAFLLNDLPEPIYIATAAIAVDQIVGEGEEKDDDSSSSSSSSGGGEGIQISCGISKLFFSSISWYRKDLGDGSSFGGGSSEEEEADKAELVGLGPQDENIEISESYSLFSIQSNLIFPNLSQKYDGIYECRGRKVGYLQDLLDLFQLEAIGDNDTSVSYRFEADPLTKPFFIAAELNNNNTVFNVTAGTSLDLRCNAFGNPRPAIVWLKDGREIYPRHSMGKLSIWKTSQAFRVEDGGRLLHLISMDERCEGRYECQAKNSQGQTSLVSTVLLEKEKGATGKNLALKVALPATLVMFIIAALVVYHKCKLKQTRKQIPSKEIERFKKGDPKGLEALRDAERVGEDLLETGAKGPGLAEAAHMLPYAEDKYEFPRENLQLGTQIGSGAFGRVFRAQARGIYQKHETTTVAVKTLKFQPDTEHLKSLMSELKMLIHIGKHPRLLNVLGACTKRLKDKELYVILEYCPYGSLSDLLKRCRKSFNPAAKEQSISLGGQPVTIPLTGTVDDKKSFFGNNVNYSSGSADEDCSGTVRFHSSDSRSGSPVQYLRMTGSVSSTPELTMGDLILWSLHVAQGMTYLKDKKVLHGDLASR